MTTVAVANSLMAIFVPVGVAGAVIALACALLAGFAMARGWAGLCAGAVGVWIVGTMLSLSASFASLWLPVLISLAALATAIIVGGLARLVLPRAASALPA